VRTVEELVLEKVTDVLDSHANLQYGLAASLSDAGRIIAFRRAGERDLKPALAVVFSFGVDHAKVAVYDSTQQNARAKEFSIRFDANGEPEALNEFLDELWEVCSGPKRPD
jgi:hypothetical protein